MKTTKKSNYEHKLYCFLKELYTAEDSKAVYRKYGFTEDDWHKAIRLRQHIGTHNLFADGIGYKKSVKMLRDKSRDKSEYRDSLAKEF